MLNIDDVLLNNINLCFVSLFSEIYLIFSLLIIIPFFAIIDKYYKYSLKLFNLGSFLTILIIIYAFTLNINSNFSDFITFNDMIINNNFTTISKNIVFLVLICITFLSMPYFNKEKIYAYEYIFFLILINIGLNFIISTNNLLIMYLGIEIISLIFYILSTFKLYSNFSTEAGIKYFILGSFSSGLLLYGITLIYSATGSLSFSDINLLYSINDTSNSFDYYEEKSLIFALIYIIIGFLFKLGAVPFHMWLPDVYEGVPTIITTLFAILPKFSIFILFFNFNLNLFSINILFLKEFFFIISYLSIFIGTIGALYQTKIKRLLAYSAISHIGFLILGFLSFNPLSIVSLSIYLISYIIISLNIFTLLLCVRKYNNNLKLKTINEFITLTNSNPLLVIVFALILFSIAGIPPLLGFFSKYFIFLSAIESKFYFSVIFAAIFSVIGSLYYIRLIKLMLFKKYYSWNFFQRITWFESYLLSITLFLNILFFIYPTDVINYLILIILESFLK